MISNGINTLIHSSRDYFLRHYCIMHICTIDYGSYNIHLSGLSHSYSSDWSNGIYYLFCSIRSLRNKLNAVLLK